MKTFFLLLFISTLAIAQSPSISLAGTEVELGMSKETVWNLFSPNFSIQEDDNENFYIADKKDNPVGIIFFGGESVVKVIKDWGTAYKTNTGAVFKTLWNVFKQYGSEIEVLKIMANEIYTPSGEKYSINFYLDENKYIEINIYHNVLISEILEEPNYNDFQK